MRARRTGATLDWPKAPDDHPPVLIGGELDMTHPAETERGVYLPVQIYPMFETAIRAAAGRPPDEHLVAISELWAAFSEVAAKNPFAWIRDVKSAEEIRTATPANRLVGLPYRKYMNSNNDVDMAAALIMCTVETAAPSRDRRGPLGLPARRHRLPRAPLRLQPRHVHPHAGGRDRRAPGARARRPRHRRRRAGRPVLVLPVGRPARRPIARARSSTDGPPAHPHRRAVASPAGRGTTT